MKQEVLFEDTYIPGSCDTCGTFINDCICDLVIDGDECYFEDTIDSFSTDTYAPVEEYLNSTAASYDTSPLKKKELASFSELTENFVEFVDYEVVCRKRNAKVSIIAPHGGKIEPGTTELADFIAKNQFNFYSLIGYTEKNAQLHITSHKFDDSVCLDIIRDSSTVIAVHGCKGSDKKIYMGGLNILLKNKIHHRLLAAGFDSYCTEHKFQGKKKTNICNMGATKKGVQIELTRAIRDDQKLLQEIADVILNVLKTHRC